MKNKIINQVLKEAFIVKALQSSEIQRTVEVLNEFKDKKPFSNVINFLNTLKHAAYSGIDYVQSVEKENQIRDAIQTLQKVKPQVTDTEVKTDLYKVLNDLTELANELRKGS